MDSRQNLLLVVPKNTWILGNSTCWRIALPVWKFIFPLVLEIREDTAHEEPEPLPLDLGFDAPPWCYQKLCDEPDSTVGHYIPSVAQHRVLHRTLVEHQSTNSKLFYLWGLRSFIFFVPQQWKTHLFVAFAHTYFRFSSHFDCLQW